MEMPSMQQDQIKSLIERYIGAYNKFDVAAMTALLDENVVFENYSGTALTHRSTGIAEFRELAERGAAIFTEREQRIESIEFQPDGPTATVIIDYHGVLARDLSPELKAGETLNMTGKSVFGFENNLISYLADYS